MRTQGSSSLTQIQQTTSPDGSTPTPEADVLPEAVMFPIISERGGAGDGTPGPAWQPGMTGADRKEAGRRSMTPSNRSLAMFGRMDALEGLRPHHKDNYPFGSKGHGQYLRGWNETAGTIHGTLGDDPINRQAYAEMTGRPDLYQHYLGAHSTARAAQTRREGHEDTGDDLGGFEAARRTAGVPGTPAGACPACGGHNTTQYAHENECQDCGHTWGRGRSAARQGQLPGWWRTAMEDDSRPKEQMPQAGQTVGDTDSDTWDYGTNIGSNDKSDRVAAGRCGACGRPTKSGLCQGCKMPTSDCTCVRKASLQTSADFMTKPHQTTDDYAPVPNSAETSPDPWSQNEGSQDFQAGLAEGRQDAAAGRRPTFMDNSETVSPYVKGYAMGYSGAQPQGQPDTGGHPGAGPRQNPDVPRSMGGDSGQAMNDQRAQQAVQVARAGRISRGFVSTASSKHPDFRKAYAFATRWQPGGQLVAVGNAYFEAGLYAGMSDREPAVQRSWVQAHRKMAARNQGLRDRIFRHASFSESLVPMGYRVRKNGVYAYLPIARTAGTSTDLISDGPGSSPDPMGSTPLNGPGTPPPSGGRSDPARPGGPAPYQGAQPAGAGPVVQDDVQGVAQEPAQPVGPIGQGFSGPGPGFTNEDQRPPSARGGPEQANLAPQAPNNANSAGYSNPDAYQGNPSFMGGDRVAAFRHAVQAGLKARQAADPKGRSLGQVTGESRKAYDPETGAEVRLPVGSTADDVSSAMKTSGDWMMGSERDERGVPKPRGHAYERGPGGWCKTCGCGEGNPEHSMQAEGSLQRTADLESDLHHALRTHKMMYQQGHPAVFSPDANMFDIHEHLRRMGRPVADEDQIRSTLKDMQMKGYVWPGAEWDSWGLAGR